jgi:hypothetical protein
MKTKSIGVFLLVASMGCNVWADSGRGYSRGPHHGYQNRHHGSNWVAPLLFLGLAGAVIGAAASQSSPPPSNYYNTAPAVTYVAPPTYIAPALVTQAPPPPPSQVWYFCQSARQYYPYTAHCPEGWQLVSPAPR